MIKEYGSAPPGDTSKRYSCQGLINLVNSHEKPTQQAFGIEYAKTGFYIFPCGLDKTPIVDHSLRFVHGFKDAKSDLKLIARTWRKYPDAGIGLALPEDLIVIDLDVKKDDDKRPILVDGKPDIIGLKSFQGLIAKLNLSEADLDTLTVKTQSGGRHFYYRMPEGIPSFNHTHAMEGLDIKGFNGYVILPNSEGNFGKYEFLNLTEIKPIPKGLLDWILKLKGPESRTPINPDVQDVTDRQVKTLIEELRPVWIKASGERWKLGKAISGALYRAGWSLERADFVMQRLCDLIPNGREHRQITRWVYAKMKDGTYKIEGFTTLKTFIRKLEEGQHEQ